MHTIEIYLKTGAVVEINRNTEDGTPIQEAQNLLDALDTQDILGFIDRNLDGSIRSSIQIPSSSIAGYRVYNGLKHDAPNQFGGPVTIKQG